MYAGSKVNSICATNIRGKNRQRLNLTFMIAPLFLLVLAFSYVPLFGWSYAFFRYELGKPLLDCQFVGFKYFKLAISEAGGLLPIIRNTLALSILSILSMPIPVLFAIFISEAKSSAFKRVVQTTTTFPFFISWIIVYSLIFNLFSLEGFVNILAIKIGLLKEGYNFLGSDSIAWFFQTGLSIWKNMGWNAIIYLAAIAGIDQQLYEAAKVDGAGRFRSIFHITIPGIMPTFIVLLLLHIASILNNGFDQYFMFINPFVQGKLEVLDYYVYRVGLGNFDYSYSTALGMFKTIISLILLFGCNQISRIIRGRTII